ncbi:MAG: RluA family pseudouridine synthase [Pseudomonadales bacterium]|nr:RluA family pseudouridine synthase [Pseudomonadales bacterium]
MRELKGVPRQHVYKVIRSGEVRVNSGRAKPKQRLAMGDKVRIPPIRTTEKTPIRPAPNVQLQLLEQIIFEDEQLLVLNKPAGIAVHGGSAIASGIVEQLRLAMENPRLELVHRLDRETSGCLMLAKKPSALKAMQAEFRERRVKKIYQLIVRGLWPQNTHTVSKPLLRYETSWGERRVKVAAEGQSARTDFQIIQSGGEHTWLQARLHTGRTHQIRVHTATSGCPVVGDDKYDRDANPDVLLMLHASKLHIPYAGDALKLTAPIPARLSDYWQIHEPATAPQKPE